MIGEVFHDLPASALGLSAAETKLVLDGRIALLVGGITGVKGNTHSLSPCHLMWRLSGES